MAEKTVHEDQKKRSLAALERRFAAAKAELDLSHNKPSSIKKGNYTFMGHASSEDFLKSGSTYLKLPQSIDENLITYNSSDGKESKVDNFLDEIFRNGEAGQKYAQGSRSLKIDNWVLLDNFVQGRSVSTGSHLRALRIHSKRSKKHMSMKKLKNNGALDLPKEFHKYKLFLPVHEFWKNMMEQHLEKNGVNQLAQHFMDIDLHGALLSVVECKTASSLTGVSGIMIRETAETFGIVTRDDKFRVVPKKCSVFVCQFDTWKVTLLGDKLSSRNTIEL